MFNIIPLLIILGCLALIMAILIRKFPHAAALDVTGIPTEKSAATKKNILHSRIDRKVRESFSHIFERVSSVGRTAKEAARGMKERLMRMERVLEKTQEAHEEVAETRPLTDEEKRIALLLAEAEEFVNAEEYATAEKKYIEAISINPKHIESYRGLGELYLLQNEFDQAKETFAHILRLDASDHQAHFELAEVHERLGNLTDAIAEVEKALEFEPEHVKYLDFLLSVSIQQGDKARAQATLERISDINPENNKIDHWQQEIDAL